MQRILLVDDDEVFLDVLERSLRRRGFETLTASSNQTALESAKSFQPSHAVIDLRIASDSGLDLISNLKAVFPDIKMVMLTGYASVSTAVEAIKLGAVHYLMKPTDVEDIIAAFDKLEGDARVELSANPPSVQRMEWEHIQKVLQEHDNNISAAARALGMHRRTLQRKLQKYPVKR